MAHVQRTGRTEVMVRASLPAVWEVVSDVTRTGEWSHECVEVRWLGAPATSVVGARFRGLNRAGWVRWGRICEITEVQAPHLLVWRVVPTLLFPDSTVWRMRLDATATGTRIVQEFAVVRVPRLLEPLYLALVPSHQDRAAALSADLHRLGAVAARSASSPSVPAPVQPESR